MRVFVGVLGLTFYTVPFFKHTSLQHATVLSSASLTVIVLQALTPSGEPIFRKSDASKIFALLTPLRLLLLAEKDRTILDLEGNLEERADTIIFCFNQVSSRTRSTSVEGGEGYDVGQSNGLLCDEV